jgi:hypothetical protein
MHPVNFAAKLVHTKRALSIIVINSHQEPVSGQACNPPDPHSSFLSLRGGGALRYLVPKWLLFLIKVGSGFHCLRSFPSLLENKILIFWLVFGGSNIFACDEAYEF